MAWRTAGRCCRSASWPGSRGCRCGPSGSGPMRACCRRLARTGAGRRLHDARRAWPGWSWSSRCASWGLARRVLGGQVSIAEVAAVHLDALDAQIRGLRLHRAVLAVAVKRAVGKEDSAYELPRSSGSRTRR